MPGKKPDTEHTYEKPGHLFVGLATNKLHRIVLPGWDLVDLELAPIEAVDSSSAPAGSGASPEDDWDVEALELGSSDP